MKSVSYPIALPEDFLKEFKQAAQEARVSTAHAIRQSAKLGLAKFREQNASSRVTNVPPLPDKVAQALYSKRDDDVEVTRAFMAAQSKGVPE